MFESIWDDIKYMYRTGGSVTQLILINIAVFAGIHILALLLTPFTGIGTNTGMDAILRWTAVPSDPLELITRPWTIITYMFLHEGFFHIIFNMLILYWFGSILRTDLIGDHRIIPIYILGGLAGFLIYFVSANIGTENFTKYVGGRMLGASAGVMAIVWAAATKAPNYRMRLILLGPVKIIWIAAVLFLVDIIAVRQGSNTGGHLAHIGGAVAGFLFVRQLDNGIDWGIPIHNVLNWFKGLFDRDAIRSRPVKRGPRPKRRPQRTSAASNGGRSRNEAPRGQASSDNDQERIDAILDKIKESGYDNLTAEEKAFLYNASKRK